jgi:acyl dehydratase
MLTVNGPEGLEALVGQHIGWSEPIEVTQQQVDTFADATGDHQWIHVDPERAKAGPFGGTIAHGYMTLSLLPMLNQQIYRIDGLTMGINYGTNKVRFPSPVPVGSRVRAGTEILEVNPNAQGAQAVVRTTIEVEGGEKPACVAESVVVLVA